MRKLVLAAVLVLMASGAQAVTLDVVGGQLMGASGVLVDGSLYDVEFLDGTCIDLYDGCDAVSDFTFQTEASATLASQALLDQVFLDGPSGDFDSLQGLTNGCSPTWMACEANTPWGHSLIPLNIVVSSRAFNSMANGTFPDGVIQPYSRHPSDDLQFLSYDGSTYAVWSPVPEPSTAILLGIGLAGLAARRRV